MYVPSLFTIVMLWKHQGQEWIWKMKYIYTVEYYVAVKKTNSCYVSNIAEAEGIMLSDINQRFKDKYSVISLISRIKRKKKVTELNQKKV